MIKSMVFPHFASIQEKSLASYSIKGVISNKPTTLINSLAVMQFL